MQPPSKPIHEQLKEKYLSSTWFRFNVLEPRIGDMDCPAIVEEHGPRGQSCYIVFVTNRGPHHYGCIEERCISFSAKTIEAALRHQRAYHFGHNPFICIPSSGERWYVFILLVYASGICPCSSLACVHRIQLTPCVLTHSCSGKRFYSRKDLVRHQARCHA
jgi:hypothetical protein